MIRRLAAALALLVSGCGATTGAASGPGSAARFEPTGSVPCSFRREVVRTRRGERNVTSLEGTLRALACEGGCELEVEIVRGRHEQSGTLVRELGEAAIVVAERLDARGVRLREAPSPEVAFALGSEIAQAVRITPIGTAGLALPLSGGTSRLVLGVPEDSAVPRELEVRCAEPTADGAGTSVRCASPLDRELELAPEARAQGVRATLRGAVTVEVTLDEGGLARESMLRLELDVVSRLGDYEEHDATQLEVRTTLTPLRP